MDYTKIRLTLETQIGNEIFELLNGEILEQVLKEAKIEEIEHEWKFVLEGHSFKISQKLTPDLSNLTNEVISKLDFREPIDFYISNSNDFNAYAIYRNEDNLSHIICINSGLVANMSKDELKFIIGHEIGHLISNNARLMKLIRFVYPDVNTMPLILRNKFDLWYRLSELTADRFGFLASPQINSCISGFFKLSSGLNIENINFNIDAYLEENEKKLEYFKENSGKNNSTHPINPVRIKSLLLFNNSELMSKIQLNNEISVDEFLNPELNELLSILTTSGNSELEYHRKYFIATSGLIMSGLDDDISKEEYETILAVLSGLSLFPHQLLDSIIKQGNVQEIFYTSIENILKINPGERYNMLNYIISIALADQKILDNEIGFIYHISEKGFGISRKETAQIIANKIQSSFAPNVYSAI